MSDTSPGVGDPSGPGWQPPADDAASRRVPSAEPSRSAPAERGHPPAGTVVGEVRGLAQRVEQASADYQIHVWTFQVERHDEAGNRRRPIPVEIRGDQFRGVLSDGDWVQVTGRWKHGTLFTDGVDNVTTGGRLVARSWNTARVIVVSVIGVVALAIMGFVVAGFLGLIGPVQERPEVQRPADDGGFQERLDDVRSRFPPPEFPAGEAP